MIKKWLGLSILLLSFVSFGNSFNIYPGVSPQQNFELGYSEEINNDGQGNYFELKPEANLLLNDSLRVFKFGDNNKGGWFFWNNGKLYILVVRGGSISQQGYVNKFCVANYGKVATCGENDIDLFYNDGDKYSSPDSFYFWEDIQYTSSFSVCFGYSDLEYNICFGNNYLGSGLNIGIGDLNNLSSLYGYSKFGRGIEVPSDNIENSCITNMQALYGLEALGITPGYCYGGFPIDDIFEPGQTIDDFTGYNFGYGASVFDLWNLYSGSFNSPAQFMGAMLQAYDNGQLNKFKTEPKALLMFVQQYATARKNGASYNFYDIWEYCRTYDLVYSDETYQAENACYTGNSNNAKFGYEIFKSSSGYIFDFSGGSLGVFGNKTGFSNPKEFFGRLTNLFNQGTYYDFTESAGVLPGYIVLFLFAIILLRIISRSNG